MTSKYGRFGRTSNLKVLTLLTATSINLLSFSSAYGANKAVFSSSDKGTSVLGQAGISRGQGDETHQTAGDNLPTMTTQQGIPVSDDQNSLKVGPNGPALLEDFVMREKIFHFDHERIPERVVHARGVGAHGYFEVYKPLSNLTKADVFQHPGVKTPVFVRFSTVAGSEGSTDLARDVRGFAVKFYTNEGNWDLVGNNIPVFFIQDGMKFPDLIHAVKPEPDRGFPQAQSAHDNFWDFISLTPESMHMIMWVMSDRAIPRSLRFMEGFGVHTYKLVNAEGKSTFVKFHWKPKAGMQSVLWNEALKISGADPDFHRHDLWNAINEGNFPEWELGVQTFDEATAKKLDFDPLDATKDIPEEIVPVKLVGHMVLDKTVDNFFAETEQVAFCTSNIVPGIDFSDDPLLQIRNFSYLDTQMSRLGSTNFTQLPINAPRCPVFNFQQDGHMAMVNPKGRANYEPNSWGGPRENPQTGYHTHPAMVQGPKTRYKSETFADHYSQARQFYISQTPVEQGHIVDAITFELSKVQKPEIRERAVASIENIDKNLAARIAHNLGMKNMPAPMKAMKPTRMDLPESPALSILKNGPKDFKGRKLGIFVSDGADARVFNALKDAFKKEGADVAVVAPTIGGVDLSDGTHIAADEKINGGPSVVFDAVAVVMSADGASKLASEATAKDFIADAFAHLKFIAYNDAAASLLEKAGVSATADEGVVKVGSADDASNFLTNCRKLRLWSREDKTKMADAK
ncbi:MAG: catalase [Candidatus Obscuribacterales bacterium]|nr:catalase [Candidatus Obscuribacterales bacterium]